MDRAILNKATSADDTPTPGYIFTEIAKATFADLNACQQLADYLLKKLERDNPYVKVKVLRIIKHVCDQGKPDFRRAVQKKADVVKSCLQYRGTPDPLKGDAPNKAVREEADAAIKSVFSSDSSTNAYGLSIGTEKKMQGFGSESGPDDMSSRIGGISSSSFSGGGGGSSFGSHQGGGGGMNKAYGGSGMVGFGNPNFDNAPKQESNSYLNSAMSMATTGVSRLANKVQGIAGGSTAGNMPPEHSNTSTYRAPNMGGGGGGGFGSTGFGSDSKPGGFGGGQNQPWGGNSGAARPATTATSSPGEYEARVVTELCAPGGPRVAPSAQVLEEFCRKCESLDAAAVGDQLRQKLSQPDWQTRLKALHAIESLNQNGLDGIVGHVAQFSSELLFEAQEMPQCRGKASKVLQLLGFIEQADEKPAARAGGASAAPAPAPAMDLLDMDDGPSAPPQAAAPAAAAPAASFDLLEEAPAVVNGTANAAPAAADMLDIGGSAPAPAGGGGSLFGGLNTVAPAATGAPPVAAAPEQNLLAGLDMAQQPAQQPVQQPVQQPAQQPVPQQAPPQGGGLFDNLQMGGPAPAAMPQAQPQPAPTPGTGMPGQFGAQQAAAPQMMQPQGAAPGGAQGMGMMGALGADHQAAQRTAHLNFLSGGLPAGQMPMQGQPWGGHQQQFPPGAMGNSMAPPQPGAMGNPMGGPSYAGPGMGMQPPYQGAIGSQAQPQMHPQAMGMQGGMQQPGMMGGMQQPGMPGGMQQPMGQAMPMAGGMAPAPGGSAFGFVGGDAQGGAAPAGGGYAPPMAGGYQPPAGGYAPPMGAGPVNAETAPPAAAGDSAFSFVADEMKGAGRS